MDEYHRTILAKLLDSKACHRTSISGKAVPDGLIDLETRVLRG